MATTHQKTTLLFRTYYCAALILCGQLFSTVASAQCSYDDAALHNGWGWDPTTRTSCAPVSETTGQCEDRGGYPWGWNPVALESCRLDHLTTSVEPAVVPWRANNLAVGQVVQATLPPGISRHYFKIAIDDAAALSIQASLPDDELLQTSIVVNHSDEYVVLDLGEPARCFSQPGSYYLKVSTAQNTQSASRNYQVSVIEDPNVTCKAPVAVQQNNENPDGDWYLSWYFSDSGSVYSKPVFADFLTKYTQAGDVAWQLRPLFGIKDVESLNDDSTIILDNQGLRRIDALGNQLWLIDKTQSSIFTDGIKGMAANGNTIVLYNDSDVISIDPLTSGEIWRHTADYVVSVKVTTDNRVLLQFSEGDFLGVRFFEN